MATPIVDDSIFILLSLFPTKVAIAPVVVNVEVWGLGAPYSTGYLNCFSAVKLCELTTVITFLKPLQSTKLLASINYSGNVAQAEYTPKNGIL